MLRQRYLSAWIVGFVLVAIAAGPAASAQAGVIDLTTFCPSGGQADGEHQDSHHDADDGHHDGHHDDADDGHHDGGDDGGDCGTPPPLTSTGLQILKFRDANANGFMDGDEQLLGAGWQFDVSGADLPTVVRLITADTGLAPLISLTDGVSYLVTEVAIPVGWHQTTNGGNPISVTGGEAVLYVGNIPEPATMSLLVLGGIATLIRRRNRRA